MSAPPPFGALGWSAKARRLPWGDLEGPTSAGLAGVVLGSPDKACPSQFRTMPPEDYRQTLRSLETHYQEFLRNSQDSQNFHPDDRLQAERDYTVCTQKYELLLRGLEKGKARGPLRAVVPGQPGVCALISGWAPPLDGLPGGPWQPIPPPSRPTAAGSSAGVH